MTSKDRNETRQTGTDNGWTASAYDLNKQIKDGKTIIHIGENRTKVDGTVYYGSSAAQNAINGKK